MEANQRMDYAEGGVEQVRLWPEMAAGATGTAVENPFSHETTGKRTILWVEDVAVPALHVYPAGKPNGTAVIVCPGGGHNGLAWDLEGTEIARWLNTLGVTAFVLGYRVPGPPGDGYEHRWQKAAQDAQRALAVVRAGAARWGVDPARLGIMGFSAGGETAFLAAMFAERTYDPVDAADGPEWRPAFLASIYGTGVVDTKTLTPYPHVSVDATMPPVFLAHACDDHVPAENPLALANLCRRAGIPVELHLYATGGHGYGLRPSDLPVRTWPDRMADWLRYNGWV